jgi:hypothetical protein
MMFQVISIVLLTLFQCIDRVSAEEALPAPPEPVGETVHVFTIVVWREHDSVDAFDDKVGPDVKERRIRHAKSAEGVISKNKKIEKQ